MSDIIEVLNNTRPYAIAHGNALDVLRTLPDGVVHCCVTSPPYHALRSYLPDGHADKPLEMGSEQSPYCWGWTHGEPCGVCYCCRMVAVFREVRRVLHPSGVVFCNMGDTYFSDSRGSQRPPGNLGKDGRYSGQNANLKQTPHVKQKDLLGVPAALAFALRHDGWYWRSTIHWLKNSPMPQSVRDRPTTAHEEVFLFAKEARYFYDMEAERLPPATADREFYNSRTAPYAGGPSPHWQPYSTGPSGYGVNPAGRNLWTWWADLPNSPAQYEFCLNCSTYYEPSLNGRVKGVKRDGKLVKVCPKCKATDAWVDHYAAFPPSLVRRCLRLGSSEKGICPDCGAPWVRVVEREQRKRHRPNEHVKREGQAGTGNSCGNTVAGVNVTTLGWQPSCQCGREPVPALVLDPFLGSGTTVKVANQLGRRSIGIELSERYIFLAEHRINAVEPLFQEVEPPGPRQQELFQETDPGEET